MKIDRRMAKKIKLEYQGKALCKKDRHKYMVNEKKNHSAAMKRMDCWDQLEARKPIRMWVWSSKLWRREMKLFIAVILMLTS